MIGFALQLGTNAAAATILQLAGIGTLQARVMRNLIVFPFNAMDAAVEAAFGARPKTRRTAGAVGTDSPTSPPSSVRESVGRSASCPDAEALAAYADHGLTEEEQAQVENHLVECETCRTRVALVLGVPTVEEVCTAYRA